MWVFVAYGDLASVGDTNSFDDVYDRNIQQLTLISKALGGTLCKTAHGLKQCKLARCRRM